MTAETLFQLFGGAGAGVVGVCLVVVVLFITGKITTQRELESEKARSAAALREAEEWKKAWQAERARGDANDATGRIVRDVMLSLRQVGKELE